MEEEKKDAVLRIKYFSPHNLNKILFLRQQDEFKITIDRFGADKLHIVRQYEEWKAILAEVSKAAGKTRHSRYSSKIAAYRNERNKIYLGMITVNRAALWHYEERVRKSAENLVKLFKLFGKLHLLKFNEQNSLMKILVERELRGKYAPDAANVGLGGWIERLSLLNEKINTLFTERIGEDANKREMDLQKLRNKLEAKYKDICTVINAAVIVNGDENYREFIKIVNQINKDFKLKIKTKNESED